MSKISYRKGYKYQLAEDFSINLGDYLYGVGLDEGINEQFIYLDAKMNLLIRSGYAWDGASGPTIDTADSMKASLVHDALYQLIRERKLPHEWKDYADEIFHALCLADGMCTARAWMWYQAVHRFADFAADPKNERKIFTAP